MSDVKITELTALTDPQMLDVMPVVDDPAGSPITKKVSVFNLLMTPVLFSITAAATFALTAGTAAQNIFAAAGDVFTLKANKTYRFEAVLYITKSGTTCTTSLGFALGTATLTSLRYWVLSLLNLAANAAPAAPNMTWVNQNAQTVVAPTTGGNVVIRAQGLIRVATGGTITPQLQFSATPTTPVLDAGSYIKFEEWNGDTDNTQGAVA